MTPLTQFGDKKDKSERFPRRLLLWMTSRQKVSRNGWTSKKPEREVSDEIASDGSKDDGQLGRAHNKKYQGERVRDLREKRLRMTS